MEVFTPKHLSGRSDREMTVYYNILNILGDRMVRFPLTFVRLTGASLQGPEDGKVMAESVKKYLVNVFGIDPSRIKTEGRIEPRIPSEQPGGTKDLDLLRESDRRVSISSESPEIIMEYQTGPNVPGSGTDSLLCRKHRLTAMLLSMQQERKMPSLHGQ